MNNFFVKLEALDFLPNFDNCVSDDAPGIPVDDPSDIAGSRHNDNRRDMGHKHEETQFIYRELMIKYLLPRITEYVEKTKEEIIEKANDRRKVYLQQTGVRVKDVPLFSMHIGSDGSSVDAMSEFVHRAEVETSSTINWVRMATHGDETKYEKIRHLKEDCWIRNITNHPCSVENERKIKNYLRTRKQKISFITICKSRLLSAVIMANNLLELNGSVIIEIYSIDVSAILTLCSLFSEVELVSISNRKFVVAMHLKHKVSLPHNLSSEKLSETFMAMDNYYKLYREINNISK